MVLGDGARRKRDTQVALPARPVVWFGLEQHGTDDAENRCVGADAERQHRDGYGGEPGRRSKHAERMAHVSAHCLPSSRRRHAAILPNAPRCQSRSIHRQGPGIRRFQAETDGRAKCGRRDVRFRIRNTLSTPRALPARATARRTPRNSPVCSRVRSGRRRRRFERRIAGGERWHEKRNRIGDRRKPAGDRRIG
jgi:hypothetical protein